MSISEVNNEENNNDSTIRTIVMRQQRRKINGSETTNLANKTLEEQARGEKKGDIIIILNEDVHFLQKDRGSSENSKHSTGFSPFAQRVTK